MIAATHRLIALAHQRVGTTLRRGKYTLEEVLGVGSMGAVYRATHRNGGQFAIKMLHTELVGDDATHARFLREGYIVNQVNHPGLVRVVDDDVDDNGATFLVLELLVGRTLEEEREALGGQLPSVTALEIAADLLAVLGAVHASGIVHRDVKPENVFLTSDGVTKLLDLGIARLGASRLTMPGQSLGSPAYMSPEQASGRLEDVDARTDLYGVGAILFTLLTGHFVHEAPHAQARLMKAATEPARSLFDVWPDAKGALVNVVDVALRFEKDRRWSSAEEMGRAVENVLALIRPSAPKSPSVMAPPPPQQPGERETAHGWPSPWSGGKAPSDT